MKSMEKKTSYHQPQVLDYGKIKDLTQATSPMVGFNDGMNSKT